MKGKVSKTGYRKNSPDKDNDFNVIPSGNISMFNVPHNVFGIDNFGNQQMMLPGGEYKFPGNYVTEFPLYGRKKQEGGQVRTNSFDGGLSPEDARQALIDGHILGHELSPAQRTLFAQVAGTDEEGNIVDEDGNIIEDQNVDEEMRRGGQNNLRHRNQTSKNIKSSVNELFLRNHNVYGLSGKHIYNPKAEKGGEPMKHLIPMPPHVIYMNGVAQNPWMMQMGGSPDMDFDNDVDYTQMKKGGNWIQKAVNPAHKGYCTPMTKSTCTPKRKAFAMTMKKHHGFHQMGGEEMGDYENNFDNPFFQDGGANVYAEKKMNPQQWDEFNKQRGFSPMLQNVGEQKSNNPLLKNQYQSYFDPTKGAPVLNPGSTQYTYAPGQLHQYGYVDSKQIQQKPSVQANSNRTAVAFGSFGPGSVSYKDTATGVVTHYDNKGQVIQPMTSNNVPQIGPVPTQKMGGEPCYNCGGAMQGGGEFLKAIVKNAYKDVTKMKKGGQSSPQGMTGDDIRMERSSNFKNYLSNNAMKAIALEEIENLNELHRQSMLHGGGYMQQGGQMSAEWMKNMGYSDGTAGEGNFQPTTANTGITSNPMPQFYPDINNNGQQDITSKMSSDQLAGQQSVNPERSQFDLMSNDMQKASFQQQGSQQQNSKGPNWMQRNGTQLAEGIIGTENLFSSMLNARNTRSNENLLKQRMDADNMFASNKYGSANRGEYDANSGVFKPNQNTPVQNRGNMKQGGEHEGEWMTAAEIKKLKAQGYHIEFLD